MGNIKSLKKQTINCTRLVLRLAVARPLWQWILPAGRGGKREEHEPLKPLLQLSLPPWVVLKMQRGLQF